jgi:hypothetical protein
MPKAKALPPLTFLNECFHLVEDSRLFWREDRPLEHFKSERGYRIWTTKFAGKEVGGTPDTHGYRITSMILHGKCRSMKTHRLIWALHYQDLPCPTLEIDHINGVRDDNHIDNMRLVSTLGNQRNARMRSHNTSGVNGVYWDNSHRKWKAQIVIDGKYKNLGRFDDIEEAASVRKAASIKHGYTERHGE